jgi:hypothetical protein
VLTLPCEVGKNLTGAWDRYEKIEEERLERKETTSVRPMLHSQLVKWD